MNGQEFSVPIKSDENGYFDRQCPSEECKFVFKVDGDDWKNIFKDESVYCPMCRHSAPSDEWATDEQIAHVRKEAINAITHQLHHSLKQSANNFNRRHSRSNDFISISMKVSGNPGRSYVIPASATEVMEQEITCDKCKAKFSVIGSAFFCPCCGHNSVERTFEEAMKKIQTKAENIDLIRNALIQAGKKDEAEITAKSLIESCVQDGVTSFQKYATSLFSSNSDIKIPFNIFQKLEEGSALWKKTFGVGFSEVIPADNFSFLKVVFQKRHLLSHNEGIVDEKYLERSNDTSYKIGQRIVITIADIDRLSNCLKALGSSIKASVTE